MKNENKIIEFKFLNFSTSSFLQYLNKCDKYIQIMLNEKFHKFQINTLKNKKLLIILLIFDKKPIISEILNSKNLNESFFISLSFASLSFFLFKF